MEGSHLSQMHLTYNFPARVCVNILAWKVFPDPTEPWNARRQHAAGENESPYYLVVLLCHMNAECMHLRAHVWPRIFHIDDSSRNLAGIY